MAIRHDTTLAYVIGIALGDGNLSNSNGRAVRLRVTCDSRYQNISDEIVAALKTIFPTNKVSIVPAPRPTYFNISVYSNKLSEIMPWKVGAGSKAFQQAHVPGWILKNKSYSKATLRGLIQTDGSIYTDRGYKMINFTSVIKPLADDVISMMQMHGFNPRISQTMQKSGKLKYTVRLARNVEKFINLVHVNKYDTTAQKL